MRASTGITTYLHAASAGEPAALGEVFDLVYDELHALARRQLRANRSGLTLDTTALVHEAFERLSSSRNIAWVDRGHFYAVAARAMRFIAVDHARRNAAAKRGGAPARVTLDRVQIGADDRSSDLLALDEALRRLTAKDRRLADLVELKFFGGLTVEEIAQVKGTSERTIKRDWQRARLWLFAEMRSVE